MDLFYEYDDTAPIEIDIDTDNRIIYDLEVYNTIRDDIITEYIEEEEEEYDQPEEYFDEDEEF